MLSKQKFLFISTNPFLSKQICLNGIMKISILKLIPYALSFARNLRVVHRSRVWLASDPCELFPMLRGEIFVPVNYQ